MHSPISYSHYKNSISCSGALDKNNLSAFRELRSKSLNLLLEDPQHSVSEQISNLVTDYFTFRMLNEMLLDSTETNKIALKNSLLFRALKSGYFSNLILGVSRLTDPYNRNKNKNVVSLSRIFKEIKEKKRSLTREVFVCLDSPWYGDFTPKENLSDNILVERFVQPSLLHSRFDTLAKVSPNDRKRDDLISEEIFEEVDNIFEHPVLKKIKTLRNKYVSHAADSASRPEFSVGISFRETEEIITKIILVKNLIQTDLLLGPFSKSVPVLQFDPVENLEKAFFPKRKLEGIRNFWVSLEDRWKDL